MHAFLQDAKYALRPLRKNAGWSIRSWRCGRSSGMRDGGMPIVPAAGPACR
jgi:hypothetical protein